MCTAISGAPSASLHPKTAQITCYDSTHQGDFLSSRKCSIKQRASGWGKGKGRYRNRKTELVLKGVAQGWTGNKVFFKMPEPNGITMMDLLIRSLNKKNKPKQKLGVGGGAEGTDLAMTCKGPGFVFLLGTQVLASQVICVPVSQRVTNQKSEIPRCPRGLVPESWQMPKSKDAPDPHTTWTRICR